MGRTVHCTVAGSHGDTIPPMIGASGAVILVIPKVQRCQQPIQRCIIKLGTVGVIVGFDIDTSNFNGRSMPNRRHSSFDGYN